jgi:hypothetical protein
MSHDKGYKAVEGTTVAEEVLDDSIDVAEVVGVEVVTVAAISVMPKACNIASRPRT